MNRQYALGIDFGTESGRVMLVRLADGEEIAYAVVPYPSGVIDRRLPSGLLLDHDWALQDPRDYLTVLTEGVLKVMRESGATAESIAGIGVDFTACTMLPTLADGTPLCTLPQYAGNPHAWVKLWKHHAAQPEATRINELAASRGEDFLRVYGGKVSSEWFFSKSLQILDEAPEIYAAADRLIEAADWIVWRMTGQERRNECTAGYKGMWIKGKGFPPADFLRALHPGLESIGGKLAAEYHALGARAGGLTEELAQATGLRAGTPVAVGNVDAHAAVPACGVTRPGSLVMIMGTSICHMLLASERRFVEGMCGVIEDGIVPGLWGYEAGQSGAGDIYAWLFRTVGVSAEALTEKALALKPGQTGLLALDWWNGNRSVLVDADQQSGEIGVHQHGAVAVPPVESEQSGLPGLEGESLLRQRLRRDPHCAEQPGVDVARTGLAGFIAPQTGHDAILDDAAHAFDKPALGRQQHVTNGSPHDHDEAARTGDAASRDRGVRVHIADRHRSTRAQAGRLRQLFGQPSGSRAQSVVFRRQFAADRFQARMQRTQEIRWRESLALDPHPFVARRAFVAPLLAGHAPDDPVGGFDQPVGGGVDFRRFIQDLQRFREEPLRGDLSPVHAEKVFSAGSGQFVDAGGFRLCGVM